MGHDRPSPIRAFATAWAYLYETSRLECLCNWMNPIMDVVGTRGFKATGIYICRRFTRLLGLWPIPILFRTSNAALELRSFRSTMITRFVATMDLSATRCSPACSSRISGWELLPLPIWSGKNQNSGASFRRWLRRAWPFRFPSSSRRSCRSPRATALRLLSSAARNGVRFGTRHPLSLVTIRL